jgi:hypothetical protein
MSDFDDDVARLQQDRDRLIESYEKYYTDVKALSVEYRASQREFLKRWKSLSRRVARINRDSGIAGALDSQPLSADNIPTPLDPEDLEEEAKAKGGCLDNVQEVYEWLLAELTEEYRENE